MSKTEIRKPASKYEDHDDCLTAASEDVAREMGLETWQCTARWADEQRDEIVIVIEVSQ